MISIIVAGFGVGGAFRDPGSIDPDRGSGTRVDRDNLFLGRDPLILGLLIPLILYAALSYILGLI
jgi:hypothetical protein